MQVTGGQFKSRKLASPIDARSTLSIVREGVFSILNSQFKKCGEDFSSLKFLDMFSGSAIMAIEAYSRGFEVLGIEKNPSCLKVAKHNFKKLGLQPFLIAGDAIKIVRKSEEKFDVIYLDPPWDMDYTKIIILSSEKLEKDGVIICESDKTKKIDFEKILPENCRLLKEKIYGRTKLSIICQN